MATYYVNKITGNDSYTTTQAQSGSTPWKSLKKALATVPTGTHTVEVMENTGPYIVTDLGNLSQNAFYPQQNTGSDITWNWNGNALRGDVNVNNGGYKWTKSNAAGKENWYYLTALAGTVPQVPDYAGTLTNLPQVKTAIVNDWWSAESTNLTNVGFTLYGRYSMDNWAWGDFDTLGFSTLYVLMGGGFNPTGSGVEIWVPGIVTSGKLMQGGYPATQHTHNDLLLSGANLSLYDGNHAVNFIRSILQNVDQQCINLNQSTLLQQSAAKFCKFLAGHAAVFFTQQQHIDLYHCHTENAHTVAKLYSNTAYTFNYYNNTTKNLLAGVIQKDVATPTLNEDYNQHHIDPDTTHGGAAIAFTTGTRQWTTTGAHDFPASAATTGMGVDLVSAGGSLPNGLSRLAHAAVIVTGVNDGVQEDISGNVVGDYPNIGADQFDYAPGFGPWATCDGILPLSAQPCKSHALPIGTRKITAFPGVASSAQIEEAK